MKIKCIFIIIGAMLLCSCGKEQGPEMFQTGMMPVMQAKKAEEPAYEGEIGRFVYYPYSAETLFAPSGTNEVCFYFEKGDIIPNTGYVRVYDAFTGLEYDAIDVSDTNRCKINSFDDASVQYTGWENGSSMSVFFDRSFLPDGNYFLTAEEGCFMTEDGAAYSREISDTDQVVFGIAPYGLNSIDTTILENFTVGETYNLGVLIDGAAAYAIITDYDGRTVSLDKTKLMDTDFFTLEFLQMGESSITVSFYDAADNLLNTVAFRFQVI